MMHKKKSVLVMLLFGSHIIFAIHSMDRFTALHILQVDLDANMDAITKAYIEQMQKTKNEQDALHVQKAYEFLVEEMKQPIPSENLYTEEDNDEDEENNNDENEKIRLQEEEQELSKSNLLQALIEIEKQELLERKELQMRFEIEEGNRKIRAYRQQQEQRFQKKLEKEQQRIEKNQKNKELLVHALEYSNSLRS